MCIRDRPSAVSRSISASAVRIANSNNGVRRATLSLIHISEPTRLRRTSSAVFCLKKKNYPYNTPQIKWNKSNANFTSPDVCGGCHRKQYEEWTGSVHSLALQEPVYQGELSKAYK